MPSDWLLDHILNTRYCRVDHLPEECLKAKREHRIQHSPALLKHIGHFSSLNGKIQDRTEPDFRMKIPRKKNQVSAKTANPKANLTSSIEVTICKWYSFLQSFAFYRISKKPKIAQ